MSIRVMSSVWDHSKASGTPLLVLLCLADWANDDGECWPSISSIAKKCRLKDDRHVKRVIHETLEVELGEVVVIPGGGKASVKGGVRSNKYRIVVHLSETVADEPLSDSGSPTTVTAPDSGSPTTRIVVEQPPRIVVEQPPEPSVRPVNEPSFLPMVAEATSARHSDLLFDALATALCIDTSELTPPARGAMNRALKDLRSVGAGPEEIRKRADNYRARWPKAALTPTALARHWPQLTASTPAARSQSMVAIDDALGRMQ